MFGVVFVRRLREGKTYTDFRDAWYPEQGFGVPSRVISGIGVSDPREIVTLGFVDAEASEFETLGARLAESESRRHDRITEVIETTAIRLVFEVNGDDNFTDTPRPIEPQRKGFPWTEPDATG